MSSHLFPGLISHHVGPIPHRIFLGAKKQVESSLLRQMQSVHPWLLNTVKVRGAQGQEFYELDLSTNHDAEVLLRWCQIFYVRRELTQALLSKSNEHIREKCMILLEKKAEGDATTKSNETPVNSSENSNHAEALRKPKSLKTANTIWYKLPDEETSQTLRDIFAALERRRLPYEHKRLKSALQSDSVTLYDTSNPVPREIKTASAQAFNKKSCAHFLIASRYVIEDVLRERHDTSNALDFERRAKYFLPRKRMEGLIEGFVKKHLPPGLMLKLEIDPKALKAVDKLVKCTEYRKLAAHSDSGAYATQIRPFDLRSIAKFHVLHRTAVDGDVAEGTADSTDARKQWFMQCVWGNFLMRVVSHPGWLLQNSNAWQWELTQIAAQINAPKERKGVHTPENPGDSMTNKGQGKDLPKTENRYRMPLGLAMACSSAPYVLPGSNLAAYISLALPADVLNKSKRKSEWTDWHDNMQSLPLPRVLPYIGEAMAVDLLATIHVDAYWKKLNFAQDENFTEKNVMRTLHKAYQSICALGWEEVLRGAVDSSTKLYGDLTDAENRWMSENA